METMLLTDRISAFARLGTILRELPKARLSSLMDMVGQQNPWFVPSSIEIALSGIQEFLKSDRLTDWVNSYQLEPKQSRRIGVAMAGNIPLVGFHDLLCVLIAGHFAKIKLSSQDSVLPQFLLEELVGIESRFKSQFENAAQLKDIDAVIATGSDNTARYFEYYFRNIPHIIRKNRSSCAVIMGEESPDDLRALGHDVFTYFGLGCRNVSKVYVPEGYDFKLLLDAWPTFESVIHHHKYANNYDYQKSILLVNRTPFFDNGFVLLTENSALVSPISVLFYETYSTQNDLRKKLKEQSEKIQCVVSAKAWYSKSIEFGRAQFPGLSDYADNIDTLKFLQELT